MFQEKFSAPDSDQLGQLQSQVDEVKDVMTQNIEKVMERGERLEDLIAQTDDLEAHVSELKIFKIYECDRKKKLNNPQREF